MNQRYPVGAQALLYHGDGNGCLIFCAIFFRFMFVIVLSFIVHLFSIVLAAKLLTVAFFVALSISLCGN